jgi:hypothetical protein
VVDDVRLWHVALTLAGAPAEPLMVRGALQRLSAQRPFLQSVHFAVDCAVVEYWEEAESLLDASSLALRVWNEHRETAGLPQWEVVGLEVLEREVYTGRSGPDPRAGLRPVTPFPY